MMTLAPTVRAKCISRVSNGWTSMLARGNNLPVSSRNMSTRSSIENSGPLSRLIATPITR